MCGISYTTPFLFVRGGEKFADSTSPPGEEEQIRNRHARMASVRSDRQGIVREAIWNCMLPSDCAERLWRIVVAAREEESFESRPQTLCLASAIKVSSQGLGRNPVEDS